MREHLLAWLDSELAGFPDRASGEELYEFLVRQTKARVEPSREALVGALTEWIRLRSEPKTMLAVKLAAEHRLTELRHEIERLLSAVETGNALHPGLKSDYAAQITKALGRLA